jgi:Domain of unknown function (DUF4835)
MILLKRFIPIILIINSSYLFAQELNFTVTVANPQARATDPKVFKALETSIRDFLNNTKWTEDVFETQERLTGNILLTIKEELSTTAFRGELSITSARPIHGSDASTPLLVYLDKDFTFSYEQFQPLQYAKNVFNDNLTAVFSYYAFCILATDYDSFASVGGDPYWQAAQDIANGVPSDYKAEWQGKNLGNSTRYWLMENATAPRFRAYRQAMYDYHRLGLDIAGTNVEKCKGVILQALDKLKDVNEVYPNALLVRVFGNTKGTELIEIFKNAGREQKTRVIAVMSKLDPASAGKFAVLGY